MSLSFAAKVPYLANPVKTFEDLDNGTYPLDVVPIAAALLPIMYYIVMAVMLVIIIYSFFIINREKKYIQRIEELSEEEPSS
jgi:hypothetical protein